MMDIVKKLIAGKDFHTHYQEAASEILKLRAQLPEEMQDCTIYFKECEFGHGTLTATNWVQHECHVCLINSLRQQLTKPADDTQLSLSTIERMKHTLMVAGVSTGESLEGFAAEANRHVLEICTTLINKIQKHDDTITVSKAELEAVSKDAERYRWLRSQHWSESRLFVVEGKDKVQLGTICPSRELLDEAIDVGIVTYEVKAAPDKGVTK
jgi:hypothetical protein